MNKDNYIGIQPLNKKPNADVFGSVLQGGQIGMQAGKYFGKYGELAGAGVGAIGGLIAANKKQKAIDQENATADKYNEGLDFISDNVKTRTYQGIQAKHGLVNTEKKAIVNAEQGEAVYDKNWNIKKYVTKKLDNGVKHEQGGVDLNSSELNQGDMIIPSSIKDKVRSLVYKSKLNNDSNAKKQLDNIKNKLPKNADYALKGSLYNEVPEEDSAVDWSNLVPFDKESLQKSSTIIEDNNIGNNIIGAQTNASQFELNANRSTLNPNNKFIFPKPNIVGTTKTSDLISSETKQADATTPYNYNVSPIKPEEKTGIELYDKYKEGIYTPEKKADTNSFSYQSKNTDMSKMSKDAIPAIQTDNANKDLVSKPSAESDALKETLLSIGENSKTKDFSGLANFINPTYNMYQGLKKPRTVARQYVTPETTKFKSYMPVAKQNISKAVNAASRATEGKGMSAGQIAAYKSRASKMGMNALADATLTDASRFDANEASNKQVINQAKQINNAKFDQYNDYDERTTAANQKYLDEGVKGIQESLGKTYLDKKRNKMQDKLMGLLKTKDLQLDPKTFEVILNQLTKKE